MLRNRLFRFKADLRQGVLIIRKIKTLKSLNNRGGLWNSVEEEAEGGGGGGR